MVAPLCTGRNGIWHSHVRGSRVVAGDCTGSGKCRFSHHHHLEQRSIAGNGDCAAGLAGLFAPIYRPFSLAVIARDHTTGY